MIKFKDLDNRVYEGKLCSRFEVNIKDEMNKNIFEGTFKRSETNEKEWTLKVLFNRTSIKDTEVYLITYEIPVKDWKLEMIAALGLNIFKQNLSLEVQYKSLLEFTIGNLVSDM